MARMETAAGVMRLWFRESPYPMPGLKARDDVYRVLEYGDGVVLPGRECVGPVVLRVRGFIIKRDVGK